MQVKLIVRENEAPVEVNSIEELDAAISKAAQESSEAGCPNIIFIEAPNGNELSLVVRANQDTVLGFTYGQRAPPYYVSKGDADSDHPVLTAFVALEHHTEFPRRWVVPFGDGMLAVRQFVETGDQPTAISWEEP